MEKGALGAVVHIFCQESKGRTSRNSTEEPQTTIVRLVAADLEAYGIISEAHMTTF